MSLDALFGKVFSTGSEVELGGGLDFRTGLIATYNSATKRVEISTVSAPLPSLSMPADTGVLTYVDASGVWAKTSPPTATGQVPRWTGSAWAPGAVDLADNDAVAGLLAPSHGGLGLGAPSTPGENGVMLFASTGAWAKTSAPSSGHVLTYNGTTWAPGLLPLASLGGFGAAGSVLRSTGSAWATAATIKIGVDGALSTLEFADGSGNTATDGDARVFAGWEMYGRRTSGSTAVRLMRWDGSDLIIGSDNGTDIVDDMYFRIGSSGAREFGWFISGNQRWRVYDDGIGGGGGDLTGKLDVNGDFRVHFGVTERFNVNGTTATLTVPLALPADPTTALQAATKQYVDNLANGLDVKASVRLATTGNITLSANQSIDGVTTNTGDRVLVKNQSSPAQNGIYTAAAGAWTRATDADAWTELPGAFCFVEQGTTNGDTGWTCTVNAGGTLGTTAVTWSQFAGVGTMVGGTGVTITGNSVALSDMAQATVKGRAAGAGTGAPADLSQAQLTALITSLGLPQLATQLADTVVANLTGGAAAPTATARSAISHTETEHALTGASNDLPLAAHGKRVTHSHGSAATVTVQPVATIAYPVGAVVNITQIGAGQLEIVAGAGVTLRFPSAYVAKAREQWSTLQLWHKATNEWVITGDLEFA